MLQAAPRGRNRKDRVPPAPPSRNFEHLMLPHLDAAYNLARWLTRRDHDAEDAVQDAYLRAFNAFHQFHGSDARCWLLAIVRNACYTRLSRNRAHTAAPF